MNSRVLLITMALAACLGLGGTRTARAEISDADKAFLDTKAASDIARCAAGTLTAVKIHEDSAKQLPSR